MTDPNDKDYDRDQAERYLDACKDIEARGLQSFLVFLCQSNEVEGAQHGVRVCEAISRPIEEVQVFGTLRGGWEPVALEVWGERIFAAYYDVDLEAVSRHRMRMLEQLRDDVGVTTP